MYLVCRLLLSPHTPPIYTLSLHDALPISQPPPPKIHTVPAGSFHIAGNSLPPGAMVGEATVNVPYKPFLFIILLPFIHVHWFIAGSYFQRDRKSTRLNSSHRCISYAVFFSLRTRLPSTLFPYTTLFRSPSRRRQRSILYRQDLSTLQEILFRPEQWWVKQQLMYHTNRFYLLFCFLSSMSIGLLQDHISKEIGRAHV